MTEEELISNNISPSTEIISWEEEKINAKKDVYNVWWIEKWKSQTFTISGTGQMKIWTGFKPIFVSIAVGDKSGNNTASWWWTIGPWMSANAINNWNSTTIAWECIYYWDSNDVFVRATPISFDSDWFTIDVTYYYKTTYCSFNAIW